ncbi:MAG: YebC/PmpR family DNA-binding transcriptional regulator [Verrucomicrobiales bacterium]|nr:YebC/PmpR family DNA-binding transcriptional regulator [Verrucomicrobiales bacterium]
MAGHNKWSKVKHIKAKEDAKKGKMFSRFAHEISIAARDGGGDPSMNPRLRTAIDTAKSQSMPKDNIERAIKKGTGELEGGAIEEITYEGFGPGGVGMIVQVATDNKNRSVATVRNLFKNNNGSLGEAGTVSYLFDRAGEIRVDREALTEEEMLEAALEAGADDVTLEDDEHVVITAADQCAAVAGSLREAGVPVKSQQLIFVPQSPIELTDTKSANQVLRLYDALDDCEETIAVFGNFDLTDEVVGELATVE